MKHEPGHFFHFFQFICREAVTGRNFAWGMQDLLPNKSGTVVYAVRYFTHGTQNRVWRFA